MLPRLLLYSTICYPLLNLGMLYSKHPRFHSYTGIHIYSKMCAKYQLSKSVTHRVAKTMYCIQNVLDYNPYEIIEYKE